MKQHFFLIIGLYLLLPLLPVYLFLQAAGSDIPFHLVISRIAGIYAFVWYSLQFILASRLRPVEWAASQDKRLTLHMLLATGLLVIVLIHTGFGDEKHASRIQAGFGGTADTVFLYATLFSALFFTNYFIRFLPFLIPFRDKLTSLLSLTHEKCRLLHYAMPAGLLLVIVHILLLPGNDLAVFKICMVLIAGTGLAAFSIHRFLIPRLILNHPWKVAEVIQESSSVTTLAFDPPAGKRFRHAAGQFCYICPLDDQFPRQFHPFTISSNPQAPRPTVTVKHVGDFTSLLKKIKPGTPVGIDGPYGKFTCRKTSPGSELVFIAGGIGITPMLSMLRDLSQEDPIRKAFLIWNVRDPKDLICREEVEAQSRQVKNFIFEPVISGLGQWGGRKGRINEKLLRELLQIHGFRTKDKSTIFFICGPPAMISTTVSALKTMGISGRQIHTERFAF